LAKEVNKIKLQKIKTTPPIPSLNALKNEIVESEVENGKDADIPWNRDPFILEELQSQWDAFKSNLKEQGREADHKSLSHPIVLKSVETIQIEISNSFQKVAIDNLKQDLLGFLRSNLNNSFIDIEVVVKAVDEKKLIYTNKEKFEYLSEKYPNLKEFKRRLDLDTDL